MVPWAHLREPLCGRLSHRPDFGINIFNLVIHLSKGKQSAFFRVSLCRCHWLNNVPQYLAFPFFGSVQLTAVQTSFLFHSARESDRCHAFNMARYEDMLSGVVLLSFGYLGEVNQLWTQFVKIRAAVTCPLGVDRLRSRSGSSARPLHSGTESLSLFFGFCFSSTRSPLVLYFMRAPRVVR